MIVKVKQIRNKLYKGIERRIQALSGEKPLPYKLHDGHWLRDLVTFKKYLDNPAHPDLVKMVENLPK